MRITLQLDASEFAEIERTWLMGTSEKYMHEFLGLVCEDIKERIKFVVANQLYSWSPLSATWLSQKKELGLSPKIWYASGELVNAITYWFHKPTNSYIIGVHPRKLHHQYTKGGVYKTKRTKVLLMDIIRKLEYGTSTIPPRPLLTKVLDEFRPTLRLSYTKFIVDKARQEHKVVKGNRLYKMIKR